MMKHLLYIALFLGCSKSFEVKTPLDNAFYLEEIVFTIQNQGQTKKDFSLSIDSKTPEFTFKTDNQNVYLILSAPLAQKVSVSVCYKSACQTRNLQRANSPSKMAKDAVSNFNDSNSEYEYNWTDSLFLYALAKGADKLHFGSSEFRKAFSFFKKSNQRAAPVTTPDLAPVALSALLFQNFPGNKIIQNTYSFLKSEPKNKLGALNHVGKKHRFAPWLPKTDSFVKDSIWLDSLVMYTLPAFFLGEKFNDQPMINFARTQHEIFQEKLKASNGLYKHAYFLKEKTVSPEGDYFWLRGNAWVALSLIELYEAEKDKEKKEFYKKSLAELIEAMLPYQKENGLFDTLLTREMIYNYEDLSGNSIMAYAMRKALKENIIKPERKDNVEQLANGIFHNVVKEGEGVSLYNISGPTNAFSYYWYYTRLVGRQKNLGYGVGPFILFLSEL